MREELLINWVSNLIKTYIHQHIASTSSEMANMLKYVCRKNFVVASLPALGGLAYYFSPKILPKEKVDSFHVIKQHTVSPGDPNLWHAKVESLKAQKTWEDLDKKSKIKKAYGDLEQILISEVNKKLSAMTPSESFVIKITN